MDENEHIPPLPQILHLPDPNKGSMPPATLLKYLEFLIGVYEDVPDLYLPSDQDRELFLSDAERVKLEACESEIKGWLEKSDKNNSIGFFGVHTYSTPFDAVSDLKKLIKKVVERKVKKEKRRSALKAINPPVDDAEKYLTAEEQQQFIESLPGAVDAYLSTKKEEMKYYPDIWLANTQALDYCYWISNIKKRQEKEASQEKARLEHAQYLDRLSAAVEKLKTELGKNKKPAFNYPQGLNKFKPDRWCNLPILSKQQIHNWSEPQILKSLPKILTNLIRWDTKWQVRVFPGTIYELVSGIPCLIWYFDAQVLVAANLELKECEINRYYDPGYTVKVQGEGEKLGTIYLGPVDCDTYSSFTTPIVLLSMLAKGDLEVPGISVINQGFSVTTYAIQGFEEEVEIYDDFRRFIKDIAKDQPLAKALLAKGLIEEDVAKLVEGKASLPLPQVLGAEQTFSDDSDVIAKLEVLGYKNEEIKDAMEAASLSPATPLEKKVSAILEILNMDSL
ncbi:hypothetical protein ES703_75555 [subsurface metagenome]